MKNYLAWTFCLFFLFDHNSPSAHASTKNGEFAKEYRVNELQALTLKEYLRRAQEKFPKAKILAEKGSTVVLSGKELPQLIINVETEKKEGRQLFQKMFFAEESPGIWKQQHIESKTCRLGIVFRNRKEVTIDICDKFFQPISQIFADVYILNDDNPDVESLSKESGLRITEHTPKSEKSFTLTIGDVKKMMEKQKMSFEVTNSKFNSVVSENDSGPAILIRVESSKNPLRTFWQSFLYKIDGDLLKLKEIDGRDCEYKELIKKNHCKELNIQTSRTPFPEILKNQIDPSDDAEIKEYLASQIKKIDKKKEKFDCSEINSIYNGALNFHLESSILDISKIENYRKAFSKIPHVVDPYGFFLSDREKEYFLRANRDPFPMDTILREIKSSQETRAEDACNVWLEHTQFIFDTLSEKRKRLDELVSMIQEENFDQRSIEKSMDQSQDEFKKRLWKKIKKPIHKIKALDISLDVNLRLVLDSYRKALLTANAPKKLIASAFASRDYYSKLVDQEQLQQIRNGENSNEEKKYFGVQVISGVKNHYILNVHPGVAVETGLKREARILKINGIDSSKLTSDEFDRILLRTEKSIFLETLSPPEKNIDGIDSKTVELIAKPRDVYKNIYDLSVIENKNGRSILKIRLDDFINGVSKSLWNSIKEILDETQIEGLIVDLRGNEGGHPLEAVKIASFFLQNQVFAYERLGQYASAKTNEHRTKGSLFLSEKPLVVLIDRKSKSASEILAAGLKEVGRSITIGENSFGKFVGQAPFPFNIERKRYSLIVTISEFFTQSGIGYHGKGVEPDIKVNEYKFSRFNDGLKDGRLLDLEGVEAQNPPKMLLTFEQIESLQQRVQKEDLNAEEAALEALKVLTN